MAKESNDEGLIQVLIERLEKWRLPMTLSLKERVDRGEKLNEFDIQFLEQVFQDAQEIQPLIERNPELQDLAKKMAGLYKEIMDKATENEQAG